MEDRFQRASPQRMPLQSAAVLQVFETRRCFPGPSGQDQNRYWGPGTELRCCQAPAAGDGEELSGCWRHHDGCHDDFCNGRGTTTGNLRPLGQQPTPRDSAQESRRIELL
ncbi:hypothetical protein AAFF_G00069030 [Aldrovandia affinis]|uniref:Uncharacterized protein n=1 Tax=Aldrovandia affinis TaxID=143900 RepID=A0AAD7WEH7_9TELE|nr:hypothetical protein AAFF_G00069030 [Aldrovandia affinis]